MYRLWKRYTKKFFKQISYTLLFCFIILSNLNILTMAQTIPLQENPVFTTPAPDEIKLGPDTDTAFLKDVVTVDMPLSESNQIAKIGDIQILGNQYFSTALIRSRLKPLYERHGQSWNITEFEKLLISVNKANKFKLKGVLKTREQDPTVSDIVLHVYERQPWQVSTTLDNQGRPRIGTWRGGVQLTNDSLFDQADRLSIQYIGAEDTSYMQTIYDYPVNAAGGTLGLLMEYTHHQFDPGGLLLERNAEQYALALKYTQPFDKKRVWTGDIGFMARHINVNNTHPDPRFVFAGLRFNRPDQLGGSNVYLQTFLGQDFWFGGDSKFWRIRGQALRTFNLPHDNRILLRAAAQYTPDALIPVQMFPLAGAYQVRGYSEGYLYSDNGQYYSLEHHWPIPFLSHISSEAAKRIRGVSFFDYGQGWLRSTRNLAVRETNLMSAGVGLRYRLSQYLQGFVDFAWRFGSTDNFVGQNYGSRIIEPGMRIHFGLRTDWLKRPYRTRS